MAERAAPLEADAYRPDIDGLRAIAVIAVVAFHAEIAAFRGGFIGVDIFFVISGYLITGIIFRSLENGRFAFAEFYARRANRILPGLLVVLIVCIVAGWFVLFAAEFSSLGKHVVAGSLFFSNFALWSEAGYFDSAAKPLLHLWSLAVEEQFYLVWPIVAVTAWRRKLDIVWILVAIIVLSFALNVAAINSGKGVASYYSPLTRFWQILAGGLLCASELRRPTGSRELRSRSVREIAAIAGVSLIGISLLLVSENTPWPGWWALAPVGGTVLAIAAGPATWINRMLLSNRVLVAIGLVSYPFYLWHWPLMVMTRLVNEGQLPRAGGRIALVGISLFLAFVTYRLVEVPIRFGRRKRRSAKLLAATLVVVAGIGLTLEYGVRPRLASTVATLADEARNDRSGIPWSGFAPGFHIRINTLPGDPRRQVVFIGDSHVEHYWPRAKELARLNGGTGPAAVFITHEGCPSLPGVNRIGVNVSGSPYRCDLFFQQAMERALEDDVTTVVLGGYWERYLNRGVRVALVSGKQLGPGSLATDSAFAALEQDVKQLVAAGKRVFLLLSNPVHPLFHPDSILLPRRLPGLPARVHATVVSRANATSLSLDASARLRKLAARTGGVIIDPVDAMCARLWCRVVDDRGNPIYVDSNHLRRTFSREHATFIDKTLEH